MLVFLVWWKYKYRFALDITNWKNLIVMPWIQNRLAKSGPLNKCAPICFTRVSVSFSEEKLVNLFSATEYFQNKNIKKIQQIFITFHNQHKSMSNKSIQKAPIYNILCMVKYQVDCSIIMHCNRENGDVTADNPSLT